MLALPAEARGFRERLLHHRRGVDEDLDSHGASATIQRASALSAFFTTS
jgi:hypothetical protein